MKQSKKENILIVGIIVLIIGGMFLAYLYGNTNTFGTIASYKKDVIEILNEYRSSKITNIEASVKLNSISTKLSNVDSKKDELNAKILSNKAKLISMDLSKKDVSDSQINKWIQEIKDI